MLVQIGSHQFDTDLGYETLDRVSEWRWQPVNIVGDTPILQYSGKDAPTITFDGQWYNYVGDADKVQSLEDLADESEPLALTDDRGKFHGFWVIKSLRRREAFFRPGQATGIQTDWTLSLVYYGKTKDRGV